MDNTTDDLLGLGGGGDIPSVRAQTEKRTAAPVDEGTEESRKTRRRRASLLTRDFGEPKLGIAELLGKTV